MGFQINRERYDELVQLAIRIRDAQDPEMKNTKRFMQMNKLPTIEELKAHNIIPDSSCSLNEKILAYLIFYGETEITDDSGDEWDYIFKPDPRDFSPAEIREFSETRKYIEKVLQKGITIV